MKKLVLSIAGALSLMIAAGPVYAQTLNVKGNVPFEFKVVNKTLPAGRYNIVSSGDLSSCIVSLVNAQRQYVAMVAAGPYDSTVASRTVMIFHRYGTHYYLAGVRIADGSTGWMFPRGKAEIEEARNTQPEDTMVALNVQ
ncbi:MAG TPA: hypothetical protein VMH85_10835 [Terriglobales bacterium]|nr:hypothetical protein [Terriglobales bacterium]